MAKEITLLRSYPRRYGEGKVHGFHKTADMGDTPWCTDKPIHCERIKGTVSDITCKRCKNRARA